MYFHGTKYRITLGEKLVPGLLRRYDDEEAAVERVLEFFRPADALPRSESVFMIDGTDHHLLHRIGGYVDYIYEVEPIGDVYHHDVAWYGMLCLYGAPFYNPDQSDAAEILQDCKAFAESYWKGEMSSNPAVEYRAASALVRSLSPHSLNILRSTPGQRR
jgi:hypothetical protein